MKLLEIHLCPFAGLVDTRVRFDENLTVVQGPNEAGKSTVLRALDSVLFVRTDLTPAKMRDFIRPFLPVGGGDTIAVELLFSHGGAEYRLRRQWGGAKAAAELTLPDGNRVTGEDAITTRLEPMLVASEATYRSVLLARQSGLAHTLSSLKQDGTGALRELNDILMSAIQETDGVSIDTFKARLDAEHAAYFSHWDVARNGPEGGRGLQTPWKREVGTILAAWYAKESRKQAWESAVAMEKQVDAVNARLADVAATCADLDVYVKEHAAAAASVQERRTLEAQASLMGEQLARHKQANAEWPVLERTVAELEGKCDALARQIGQLTAEAEAARRAEANKALAEKLGRVNARQAQLAKAQAALAAVPALGKAIEDLSRISAGVRDLQAKLSAGRLKARFSAREPLAVTVQCGADATRPEDLAAGQTLSLAADGTLRIEHVQWTLEVESGMGNFAGIVAELETGRRALAELPKAHGVGDEDELRALHAEGEEARRAVTVAEKNLADELGGMAYKDLQAAVTAGGGTVPVRPLAELTAEMATATAQFENLRAEQAAKAARVAELKRTYGDADRLLEKVGELMSQRKALEQQRAALPPLPAGVADPAAFAAEYQGKAAALQREEAAQSQLELERARMQLPEDSAEDLQAQFLEANEAFEAAQHKGQVLARIRQAVAAVEATGAGTDPYAGLKADVERYVARMTGNRYARIHVTETLPSGFVRADGNVIGADLLSTGTKDVLGLAVRLAMARYFLGDQEGFLVMDEPLVDMDTTRQVAAAELLRDYARDRQVVVFTCHPAHAGLFGGDTAEIC
ncbi:MAG: AAA family ATPase [Lentisphaerae bacterium]|nr:AAA family ATPase [Lentisphaerota bacterium]